MLRWLGSRKAHQNEPASSTNPSGEEVTDDPLAAIGPTRKGQKIYSVSRVNPLYEDPTSKAEPQKTVPGRGYPASGEKSSSSGYGGSHGEGSSHEAAYGEKLRDDAVFLERNASYVKSIQVVGSSTRSSSGAGTLTTIPEGRVDVGVPKPIWPGRDASAFDSLVDEALLFYTSANYVPKKSEDVRDVSVKDLLVELSNSISATMEGQGLSAEQMLKSVREKIAVSLDILRNSTEEEMRMLCVNLSKRHEVNSVVRAFSNSSSSSGNSSQSSSPNSTRVRTLAEDLYQVASGSSSSGFSDSVRPYAAKRLAPSSSDDAVAVVDPDGVRNAVIYGTLCRANLKLSASDKLLDKDDELGRPKGSLLRAQDDGKPSVWQQYYGLNLAQEMAAPKEGKVTDVPLYPGGRPEADFTLDVPRSELLSKRMKQDKKWRCRCRLLTSFLGLVFFLLSVMAVSLALTRGRRMFGSMDV